jgi:hypothetical protein
MSESHLSQRSLSRSTRRSLRTQTAEALAPLRKKSLAIASTFVAVLNNYLPKTGALADIIANPSDSERRPILAS